MCFVDGPDRFWSTGRTALSEGQSFSWASDRVGVAYRGRPPVEVKILLLNRNTGAFVGGSFTVVRGGGAVASPGMMGNGGSDRNQSGVEDPQEGGGASCGSGAVTSGSWFLVHGGASSLPHGFSGPFSSLDRYHGYRGGRSETAASLL